MKHFYTIAKKNLNNIANIHHALPETVVFHKKMKCLMNEEIVATATVIVMKIKKKSTLTEEKNKNQKNQKCSRYQEICVRL